MPLQNNVIIASAGSGKTTSIVTATLNNADSRQLITTFTLNNVEEIKKKFFDECGSVPENVTIIPWFSFLLRDLVRPYQADFFDGFRVDTLLWCDGQSDRFAPKVNSARYYFGKVGRIYSDKISDFACRCHEASDGMLIDRLERLYDYIYIDEVQDLAGYDIEVLELLLKSKITVTVSGDVRQATYMTHKPRALKKYSGSKIVDKFSEWKNDGLCKIKYMNISYRCHPKICTFSDNFFPDLPATSSLNEKDSCHDGIFIISKHDVPAYLKKYSETHCLRYNKNEKCLGYQAYNFGDAKGLTFERTMVFPHGSIRALLKSGDFAALKEKELLYVAFTRSRQSVVIVYDDECNIDDISKIKIPAASGRGIHCAKT